MTLDSYNGDRTNWLYLNTADGPCKDQAFRQALAYGIDRQAYMDSYYKLDESDEVMAYEANGGYNPREIYNQDADIRKVMDQMVDGTYSKGDTETFRELFNSLIERDIYFILKDFRSYAEAQAKVNEAYKDSKNWNKMAILNTACAGKFSSDRTIEEYVKDIWHLEKVFVR